jgi:cyclophilin family peptidyl-prolyl cis-trans isomerase
MRRLLVVYAVALGLFGGQAAARANTDPIVRFATALGNIDVRLLPDDAPQTVANFLGYVNAGAYERSFFHRVALDSSGNPFAVQGGGYTYRNGGVQAIKASPAIPNEFLDSNVRGTLAMALSGNPADPNSATDQWFFNTTDNSRSLDPQLFTVFGKVLSNAGLSVIDQIAQEPTIDLDSTFGQSTGGVFATVPTINYSGTFSPGNLVVVNSISLIDATTPPTITINTPTEGEQFDRGQVTRSDFACSDGNGVGIASCTGPATLDTSRIGPATFKVTATDYAGNTTTKVVDYFVDVPPPGPRLPGLQISGWSQSRTGAVSIWLRCRARTGCAGTIRLAARSRKTTIGSVRYSLSAGQTKRFPIKLNRKGRRLLTGTRGTVRAWFTVTRAGHAPIVRKLSLRT